MDLHWTDWKRNATFGQQKLFLHDDNAPAAASAVLVRKLMESQFRIAWLHLLSTFGSPNLNMSPNMKNN